MADEKQLAAIGVFGNLPPQKWGVGSSARARGLQDWAHLVRQISYFDCGKAIDEVIARQIAKTLRQAKNFPNGVDWGKQVNAEGAHQKILTLIREELAATTVPQ